ncbi:MAG: hypothetical protein HY540_08290 [Deltaproteobacteria bacterium]|nr:hypothetical protein [Deltaproteobacteria bacterium]
MKKVQTLLVAILALAFFTNLAVAKTVDSFERKMKLEQEIAQQVEKDLSILVPERFYHISVVANIETSKNLQSEQIVQTPQVVHKEVPVLPGFPALAKKTPEGPDRQATYVITEELASLAFYLVLSDRIPEAYAQTLMEYFQERWVAIDPASIKVITKRSAFPGESFSQGSSLFEWVNVRSLIIIAAGIFTLLLVLILSRRRTSPMVTAMPGLTHPQTSAEIDPSGPSSQHHHKDAFLTALMADPLMARSFLRSLDQKTQEQVCLNFQSRQVRDLLCRWVGMATNLQGHPDALDFQPVLSELHEFKEVRKRLLETASGFIQDLLPEEIVSLLTEEAFPSLKAIAHALSADQLQAILLQLPASEQQILLDHLHHHAIPDGQDHAELTRLREKSAAIVKHMMAAPQAKSDIIESILEASPEAATLARDFIERHPEWETRLKKFTLSIEELTTHHTSSLREILSHLENEELIAILHDATEEQKKLFMKYISKERQKILIHLMRASNGTLQALDISTAKSMLLRHARETLFAPKGDDA